MHGSMKKFILTISCSALLWSAGAVECMLLPSISRNAGDQFAHILPERPPQISTVKKVAAEEPFSMYLLLREIGVADGEADVVYDLVFLDPDGKETQAGKELQAVKGKLDPSGVFLAANVMMVEFTDDEKPGDYRFIATVRDRKTGKQATGEATVKFDPAGDPAPPLSEKEMDRFLTTYYRNPQPYRIMSMVESLLKFDLASRNKKSYSPLPMLYGIAILLRDNPGQAGEFASLISAAEPGQRLYALPIFDFLGAEVREKAKEELAPDLQEQLAAFDSKKNPLRFDTPSVPTHLDLLWYEFFFTGSFEPIRKLASVLEVGKDGLKPEDYKKLGDKATPDDRRKLMNRLMELAAGWSLTSNARQHPLVFYYLEALDRRDGNNLPGDYARSRVREIVKATVAAQKKQPSAQ
ncbi:hypothetical protein SDC9_97417 [bioreactor metagenome]|uniref:Uncharacterized protein n=1 Tax=bioreactor metagenome TaxID=1076179 RepID=A0A645ABV4_9ZZZZ